MAAASIASSGIVYEVLTTDNYENWSTLVKNYLVGQRLWDDIVEGCYPNNDDADWKSKNAQALHAIQLSCGSEILGHIRQFKTAREVWNHLKASFTEDGKAEDEDVKPYPDLEQGSDGCIDQLHRDVKSGYWNDAKSYINRYPDAIFSTSYSTGRTVLHVAVAAGQAGIVKELVNIGNKRLLKMQDKRGYTALALAAELTDNKSMAEWMVNKGGDDLLTIKTKEDDDKDEIPLLLASAKGHKEMTRYLFSQTPPSFLLEYHYKTYGSKLLAQCISAEIFDVAKQFLRDSSRRRLPPSLGLTLWHENTDLRPIYVLAHMPSAFPSGTQLGWPQRFVYNILSIQDDPKDENMDIVSIVEPDIGPAEDTNMLTGKIARMASISAAAKYIGRLFIPFQQFVQTSILLKFSGIDQIYKKKVNHHQVSDILQCLSQIISKADEYELIKCSVYDAMLQAAKYGIIEFIYSMRLANPDLIWAMDKSKRSILSHAILNRQAKVFQLIHEIQAKKAMIAFHEDEFGNNMLHLAAELGPSSYLDRIPNAALQMQRELQWFTAVNSIVPPKCIEARNKDGIKPRELFTRTHEQLAKAGEKWAKDTANSFSLVGTLILTIMFAAAFTVPGGNDQETGLPIFLNKDAYTIFITADTVALITSSSSVLLFVGILSSRCSEEDFRNRLPLKLLMGLSTLLFSMASMMCAFCAALAMMLKGYHWIVIAAILLAVVPVLQHIFTLLSLFHEIIKSTWRFDLVAFKKKKSWN